MNANFIYSTNYYDSFGQVIAKINARKVDLDVKHLLIVPERYTLLAEKYVYQASGGSFDIEVLSLSRLFYKMQIATPLLSREGAIMLIRGMLPSLKLSCFFRSASYRGFCEKLYDAINDFAGGGVAPDDIPCSSPKLSDLKTVYAEYLNRISGRFVDSMGKLELIAANALTSEYLNNVHIYAVNFDYVDSATKKVFEALKNRALSFTEYMVKGDATVNCRAEKFFGDGAPAVKEVAKRLRREAYNGVSYEDMAVIVGNADSARIKRIFTEFEVPCFMAESKRLTDYALSGFLLKLFECAQRKSRDSFVELSKNVYSGIDKSSSDEFENYVASHLIDYKGFYREFDDCPIGVERTRKRLVALCQAAEQRIKLVDGAKSFGAMLDDIFTLVGAEKLTEKIYGSDAVIEKTRALVGLMEQVGISGNFEFVSAVFAEGLKATKMSSIPYEGGVVIGDPASFRGGKYKFVAVIGFDDGFLPQIYDDSSLIGDDEKTCFAQMERADQINMRYERELAFVLASADRIFATYTVPSGMMGEIFADAEAVTGDDYSDVLLAAGSRRHAVELLISLVGRMESKVENNQGLINALFESTHVGDRLFMPGRVDRIDGADELFFPYKATSVSQLQSYFRCPFRHYAEYGLRLKSRDKGELTPIDVGNFIHEIVEVAMKKGEFGDVDELVRKIVADIVARGGKFALDANKAVIEELTNEAIAVMKIYAAQRSKGKFKPIGQEIKFEMALNDIKIGGKIDMADEYDGHIRLIDYKTGSSYELGLGDVYYGKKIQLPLYMAAVCKEGYKKAGIMNYPFSYKWLFDEHAHRFSGFLVSDENILDAIDCNRASGESDVFNLKNTGNNESLLSESEMDALVSYAVKVSENAVKEIKDGFIEASPLKKECDYCAYKCLCASVTVRKTAKVSKAAFGENDEENLV